MADLDLNNTETQHIDLDDLSARLAARASEWVPQFYPRGKISADRKELRLANISGDPPRNNGSCVIALKGEDAGSNWDFSTEKGGGPLDTLSHATGLFGRELFARAEELVGKAQRFRLPLRSNGHAAKPVAADHISEATAIWDAAQEPLGSPTEAYLASRGVGLPPTSDLRHSASLTDYRGMVARQGMVALIRNAATGEPTGGIHRTYLLDDGRPAKEEMGGKHKLALGPAQLAGGIVMLASMRAGELGVAEGIETALAVTEIDRRKGNTDPLPVWATLGDWGMANMPLPPGLHTLLIFADAGKAGIAAAEKLQDRALAAGIEARCLVPLSGDDFARDLELGLWDKSLKQSDKTGSASSVPPQTLEHILAAAADLTRNASPEAVLFVLRGIALARLEPIAERQALEAIRTKTKMPIADLRKALGGFRREMGIGQRDGWSAKLMLGDDGQPRGNIVNAVLAFEEDESLTGAIRYDKLRSETVRSASVPWNENPVLPVPWCDQDDREAQMWLHHRGIFAPLEVARDAVQTVAERRAFHPVMDYFDSIRWDGEQRLDRWLIVCVGAEDTPYTQAVGPRWMIAGVARIFEPGRKFDNCLVLEGPQGILKSTVFDVLGGPFYTNDIAALGTKDAQEQILGVWIVELDELEAVTRAADIASVKSFVSRRFDRFRVSYGHRPKTYLRQCIFGGTVNKETWQRDETGGRRWWPVKCGTIDIDRLRANRDQLWAEARDRYLAGETNHWLDTPELVAAAEVEQEKRYDPDIWEEKVAHFIEILTDVRIEDILGPRCLDISIDRWGRSEQLRIGAILRHLGWARKFTRPPGGGAPKWRWIKP